MNLFPHYESTINYKESTNVVRRKLQDTAAGSFRIVKDTGDALTLCPVPDSLFFYNSFRPITEITIMADKGECRACFRFSMQRSVQTGMSLLLALLALFELGLCVLYAAQGLSVGVEMFLPAFIGLFLYGLGWPALRLSSRRVLQKLAAGGDRHTS